MTQPGRIGVVGGGLGGLAAACVLAARGHAVCLFERSAQLGGKAAVLHEQGYRFDMGPTILTLPSVLRRIFAEANVDLEDAIPLKPCDPQWRAFFSDGGLLDLCADRPTMTQRLEAFAPGSGQGYEKFLDFSRRLHGISDRFFFWRSIGSLWDMFDVKSLFDAALLRDVLQMKFGKTVSECVRSDVPEPRVAQMLDHFTQYVGSAPDASPAVLCGIAHMQTQEGVWYPQGGTRAVPEALAKLAGELGVELRTGTGVRRILFDEARRTVTGVETDSGEKIPLAAVVSNADAVRTHRELLGGKPAAKFEKRRTYEPACSGVVLYLGLDRAYEHLAHHNFIFSRDPHEEFEAVYRRGEPAADPTCYVCAPSRSDPGVAPPGGEALYVLVHTPYLRPGHDWKKMLPDYRRTILTKLAETGGLGDIEKRIRFEAHLTPQDIHDRYHVLDGAIYGLASHGRMFGAFKPANRSRDLRGLYLAGGAAHPGPGMPMVLMSGWIAADALDRDGVVLRGNGEPRTTVRVLPGEPRTTVRVLPGEPRTTVRVLPGEPRTTVRVLPGEPRTTVRVLPGEPRTTVRVLPGEPRTTVRDGSTGTIVPGSPKTGTVVPGSPETGTIVPGSPKTGTVVPGSPETATLLPRRSAWRVKLCTRYFRRWMGKNFHAIRLSRTGQPPALQGRPVVVVLNHPSWWDPLLGMILMELFDGYRNYALIDAAALKRYRFFESLGFFGVEMKSPAGALNFLRTGAAVLSQSYNGLWITAQGKFTDPRERPVQLRHGVGHLVRRLQNAVVLPLAVEYPFWRERYAEALAHFGEPFFVDQGRDHSAAEWMARIETALTAAQDDLSRQAQTQDPAKFTTLVGGNVGVGGVYDLWRRMGALLRRRRFHGAHDEGRPGSLGEALAGGGS